MKLYIFTNFLCMFFGHCINSVEMEFNRFKKNKNKMFSSKKFRNRIDYVDYNLILLKIFLSKRLNLFPGCFTFSSINWMNFFFDKYVKIFWLFFVIVLKCGFLSIITCPDFALYSFIQEGDMKLCNFLDFSALKCHSEIGILRSLQTNLTHSFSSKLWYCWTWNILNKVELILTHGNSIQINKLDNLFMILSILFGMLLNRISSKKIFRWISRNWKRSSIKLF